MKVSITIPCYNEKDTILPLLDRVEAAELGGHEKEVIVVDDFSNDGTRELLERVCSERGYKLIAHHYNAGKGCALRTAFEHVTGDIVITQDADLEYDPAEYGKLVEPIASGESQVVYGSRERSQENKRHSGRFFYLGGLLLTWLTNLLYRSNLTDEATGYKVFQKEVLDSIELVSKRFEFCPEITAKVLKKGIPILEVPISYHPRTVADGKKIRYTDGLQAIWTLIKYRVVR